MDIREHVNLRIRLCPRVWCGALNGGFNGTIWVFDIELAVSSGRHKPVDVLHFGTRT